MSVYNRKMFKRNAREKLNQTAGIQTFQQGGNVRAGTVFQGSGTFAPGTRFLAPIGEPGSQDFFLNAQRGVAQKALSQGVGALSYPELATLYSGVGRQKARSFLGEPVKSEMPITSIARSIAGEAGRIGGGLASLGGALTTGSEYDPETAGGTMAGFTPPRDYLESLGFEIFEPVNVQEQVEAARKIREAKAAMSGDLAEQIAREDTEMTVGEVLPISTEAAVIS